MDDTSLGGETIHRTNHPQEFGSLQECPLNLEGFTMWTGDLVRDDQMPVLVGEVLGEMLHEPQALKPYYSTDKLQR